MLRSVPKALGPADREAIVDQVRPHYLETLTLVERLHRRLLDVIKDEFDRRSRDDINPVQALLLYNIGEKDLTAGELRTRGYYLGSNVSYNLKKLVEMGYLDHQRSRIDRRSVRIKLTDKGREVRDIVDTLYQKHLASVAQVGGIDCDEFAMLNRSLHRDFSLSALAPAPCRGIFSSSGGQISPPHAGSPPYVGNQLMAAPIAWRSGSGVLSPGGPPGVENPPNTV